MQIHLDNVNQSLIELSWEKKQTEESCQEEFQ